MSILKPAFLAPGICAALLGCASYTGIVPNGDGSYMLAKQAATGFSGLGNLKGEVLADADKFCAARQQDFTLTSENETKPPYIFGNYPRVEIHFKCIAKA